MRSLMLGISLLSLLFISACQEKSGTQLTQDVRQQVALLPVDADVMGFADIRAIQKSRFFEMITDSLNREFQKDEDISRLMEEMDLDLDRDIHRLYFAARFSGDDTLNVLFVTEGDFQPQKILDKIEEKAKPESYKKETFGQYELYTFEKNKAFVFSDNRHLVAGSLPWVQMYLNKLKNQSVSLDPALQKRLSTLPYANQAWMIAQVGRWTKKIRGESGKPPLKGLASLQQIAFSMEANEELHFYGRGQFDNEEKCQLFRDALKGVVAAAKLAVSDDRSVVDILNKVDVRSEGRRMEMQFEISHEDFQKLLDSKKTLTTKI